MLTRFACASQARLQSGRRPVEVPQDVLDALAAAGWREYPGSHPHVFRLWWSADSRRNLTALPGGRYTLREFGGGGFEDLYAAEAQWRFDAAGLLHWLEGHPESGR